jgi:hypothetical protein
MLSTDQGMEESELGRMFEGIPARSARTRVEAYRDLILRWRREGRTYREIQRILRERCDLEGGVRSAVPLCPETIETAQGPDGVRTDNDRGTGSGQASSSIRATGRPLGR